MISYSIIFRNCLFLFIAIAILSFMSKEDNTIKSPDKKISVELIVSKDKNIFYNVKYEGAVVLENSRLGVIMEDEDFSKGLSFTGSSKVEPVKDKYTMLYGKRKLCVYEGNKRFFHFTNSSGKKMDVIFQVSNDGVALRYYFPESSSEIKKMKEEITSFKFPSATKAWMQPMSDAKTSWARSNPSYEEHYLQDIPVGTPSPNKAGWVFPALFKMNNVWALITETGIDRNYCGTRLRQQSPEGEYVIGFPQEQEVMGNGELNPQSVLPWYSPWRVIAIGPLSSIVESTLGTDLARPAVKGDFSWVKPGRASWSWVLLKDDKTIYDVQKKFIDYAADMGWEYCLIDAVWDTQIGYDKIKDLADYGKTKNVGIFLWYNSAGDWNDTYQTPKDLMLTHESRQKEFKRIGDMGIKGVKVDFFGGDGQSVIKYYQDILDDAAASHILVNFHGCTLPRGWSRTYPNLVSMEAIRGMEFVTFGQGDADKQVTHCASIPFLRNVFDPMDFTPTAFSEIHNINRKTSNAFELALPVLFLTGAQHYAETPDGMAKVPDYVKQTLKDIPVSWEQSHFVDGFPGKYVVIGRKSSSGKWFVAGINGEETSREVTINVSFAGKKTGTLITDGADDRSFEKQEVKPDSKGNLKLTLAPHGGFVITF